MGVPKEGDKGVEMTTTEATTTDFSVRDGAKKRSLAEIESLFNWELHNLRHDLRCDTMEQELRCDLREQDLRRDLREKDLSISPNFRVLNMEQGSSIDNGLA